MARKKIEKPEIILPDDFNIVAADLSLNRPGFCVLTFRTVGDYTKLDITTYNVDNKKLLNRGEKLDRAYFKLDEMYNNLKAENPYPVFFLREHAFNSRASQYEIGIFEMVGLSNYWLWKKAGDVTWEEMYPITIKKIITGDSKADKKKVERYLADYIGERPYACDDESDATALAVAYLVAKRKIREIDRGEQHDSI